MGGEKYTMLTPPLKCHHTPTRVAGLANTEGDGCQMGESLSQVATRTVQSLRKTCYDRFVWFFVIYALRCEIYGEIIVF